MENRSAMIICSSQIAKELIEMDENFKYVICICPWLDNDANDDSVLVVDKSVWNELVDSSDVYSREDVAGLKNMKMINIEKTGERIRECINTHSSVKEVAKQLNLTLWAVYKWTYGMSLPTIDNFVNLSDILGVTIEDLLVIEEV